MELSLDALFTDPRRRAARRALNDRWRAEGYYDGRGVGEQAREACARTPNTRLVIVSPERPSEMTVADWYARATRVAGAWSAQGVGKGDVIAVQLPNCAEAAICYVAAALLGAIVVPIVHLYGPSDSDWILARTRPRVYVVPARWAGDDYATRRKQQPSVEAIESFVVVDEPSWQALEAHAPLAGATPVAGDDPYLVLFTSGTAADPKGIVHTHNTVLAELRSMPSPPTRHGTIRTMQPWPAGHVGGLTAILGPLIHGLDTYLLDRWDTDTVVELIRSERIEACSGVPTTVSRILDQLDDEGSSLPLRHVTSGGAGVPPSLIERGRRHGWHVARCYGSTEHPSATACEPGDPLDRCMFTDGRAMAGTEIRLIDGEVALIGPEQCLGYTDPRLNAELFTPEGWLLTGDVGELDGDGYLRITDRRKDLIIRGGENISAAEVEDVLLRHAAVAEAAAVSAPDDHYGERVCAVVRLHEGATITLDEIRRHFAEVGVATVKTPELLRVVTDFPRTASGKIQKRMLRDELRGSP